MRTKLLMVSSVVIAGLAVVGCSKDEVVPTPFIPDGGGVVVDPNAAMKISIKENYADIVYANYEDSYDGAVDLKDALVAFTNSPTALTLASAKQAWLDAREPYGQTEAFRFAGGPIDDADGPEGQLNAWPLDESYIDYTTDGSGTGIINDAVTYPVISATVLDGLNEQGGEENISIGYHAIEFLLWGQDDANTALKTPGNRSFNDFILGSGAGNEDRRTEYLLVVADLLLEHLELMVDEWAPNNTSNYRATFIALDNDVALSNMLTAIGTLSKSELAGERMFTALTNLDQEDEHSCFSDNTHRDIILNAEGIRNVYLGSYTRTNGTIVSGTSIKDLIAVIDGTIEDEMDVLSLATITNTEAMPVPFDDALTTASGPIMTAITSLQDQGDKISEMGSAFGLTISTVL